MKLRSTVTTYEISLEELKDHFAEQLNVEKKNLSIDWRIGYAGYGPSESKVFDGLKITIRG